MLNNTTKPPTSISDIGKTALYYEYTLVDVKEDHVIEKTLTALSKDPDVINESIRKVTYYLVQRFFIKSANERKENIDLIYQIPAAFKKMVDTVPVTKGNKKVLVTYLNLYLSHTISVQEDFSILFEGYSKVFKGFMNKLKAQNSVDPKKSMQDKEVIIDLIYQYIDSINFSMDVSKELSKVKARKKIDTWINRIYENHVIEGAVDVIIALEDYCFEELQLSKQRVDFLKKYAKLNIQKIEKEILENPEVVSMADGWPVISENIFIYIDTLTKEHGDYKKFLSEVFTPLDPKFAEYFFTHFFLISAYQKQTEKDIYLLEKTLQDLQLIKMFKSFFTSKIHEKILEGREKVYCIEVYLDKMLYEIKGPNANTFAYLTLKYLLEDTLDIIEEAGFNEKTSDRQVLHYKRAFVEFLRPKYPKFIDSIIFIYLHQSKALERKVGNTKKSYSNIYSKNTTLIEDVLVALGLQDDFHRVVLPCITGLEQRDQILKTNK